ncbi:MAG: GFA family protein [Pseudomonadota bacterium]
MSTARMINGGCECGAVRFTVSGPLRKVVYCHCKQCQRLSGLYVAATACAMEDLELTSDNSLQWYASSDVASRGFCRTCGSNLFYRPEHGRHMSIMAGTLDAPSGLNAAMHVYIEEADNYYTVNDGLPQKHGMPDDIWVDNDA